MNPGHTESHAFTTPHFGRAKQVTFPHPRYPYHLLPCAVPHRRRSTSHPWSRLFPPYRTRDAPIFYHRRGTLCPVEDDPECCSDRRIPALPSCPDGRPPPVWPQASGPNTKARNRGRNGSSAKESSCPSRLSPTRPSPCCSRYRRSCRALCWRSPPHDIRIHPALGLPPLMREQDPPPWYAMTTLWTRGP